MIVYLLRHAEAEDGAVDFERKLTAKGLEQSDKVGKFCARNGLVPDVILASPVVRAKQTAEIVAKKLGKSELVGAPWAACGMNAETCCSELSAFSRFETVMLVGHEPDFSEAIAFLCGMASSGGVRVRKASLTGVELAAFRVGAGSLQFSIPVRLM